ncbi:flagellar basal body-associated FliL family protein [Caloramator sp. E03]|uniref:flagellar basal body-associated FliL family protein n=1 Tax=Caloramator sp. E03 TaxID=2576307 RepID=UPI00111029E9|nr:flagellar basal body-associated FliL family protein [Caloramator sp. E03]QCX32342.1 flagellar basal body-associated FliL family protein [Caloramator sp. E03]
MSDKKSNKIIMILLIILLVIAVGIAAFFGYSYYSKLKAKNQPQKVVESTVSVDDIIVNLADEDTRVYLKTKISLGYTKKGAENDINAVMPQIRDKINSYLRTKKSSDFQKDGLNKIRDELLKQINDVLGDPVVTHVYFYDIIIQ